MANRDFEKEFSLITSSLAAEDPELVDHFRAKMFGEDEPETSDESIEAMVSIQYALVEEGHYKRAVGRCVAALAGVQLGSEVFSGEA
jgi:hypothetical protein